MKKMKKFVKSNSFFALILVPLTIYISAFLDNLGVLLTDSKISVIELQQLFSSATIPEILVFVMIVCSLKAKK